MNFVISRAPNYQQGKTGQCGQNKLLATNLAVSEVGSNWAEIKWSPPIYSTLVLKYDVFYKINGGHEKKFTIDRDLNAYRLNSLPADAKVEFKTRKG